MSKFSKRFFFLSVAFLFSLIFTSCSKSLGYSVLLWSNSEHEILDGTLLKVHIKSNISHVYVVSLPGSSENFEVPIWQLTEPESKSRALKQQQRFSELNHTYASVKLDGLPVRADAVNTSKQVYRLREGEIIRCLYKGAGAAVTNGKGNMEGEWLRVLTEGGTLGWCFSHNLSLFQTENFDVHGTNQSVTLKMNDLKGNGKSGDRTVIQSIISKKWYPESFQNMIKAGRIDIRRMNPSYGFSFGLRSGESDFDDFDSVPEQFSGTAILNTESAGGSWNYTDITKKAEKEYEFKGSALKMTIKGAASDTMILQFPEKGKPRQETLVALTEDIESLIGNELFRRQAELKRIASAGPVFKSSNYGTIKFNNENSVTWSNYKLLVPSIISSNALGSVTVTLDNFISNSLKSSYDGVITMHFTGMEDGVNFLYKLTDTGLRLEDATNAPMKDGVVTARSASPMILFFEAK